MANTPMAMPGFADISVAVTIALSGMFARTKVWKAWVALSVPIGCKTSKAPPNDPNGFIKLKGNGSEQKFTRQSIAFVLVLALSGVHTPEPDMAVGVCRWGYFLRR